LTAVTRERALSPSRGRLEGKERQKMANRGVVNSDYLAPEIFPGIANPDGTGAPGTAGIDASTTHGDDLGTVTIRVPDGGVRPLGTVAVTSGDTSSMSDDLPAHESEITPGPEEDYVSQGPFPDHVVSASSHGRYFWQAPAGGGR
jgi:hypothetical protein